MLFWNGRLYRRRPSPRALDTLREFRDLRIATRGAASGLRALFEKSATKNFSLDKQIIHLTNHV